MGGVIKGGVVGSPPVAGGAGSRDKEGQQEAEGAWEDTLCNALGRQVSLWIQGSYSGHMTDVGRPYEPRTAFAKDGL